MPYSRPYASGFQDFPSTTTPINATALNTMDVGIKTANDQFQTVTTAQRNALTPTVGQAVWDSDLKQLMVYMNASGGNAWQPVGNRIVCASTTRPSTPFEGQEIYETDTQKTLVYTGSAWLEIGDLDNPGGLSDTVYNSVRRLGYQERVTSYTTSQTSFAAASDIFTTPITFTADGTSAYRLIFYCPQADNLAAGRDIYLSMSVGGTETGRLNVFGVSSRNGNTCLFDRLWTPSAGSKSINYRAYHGGGATLLNAGDGTGTNHPAMFMAVYGPALT